MTLKEKLELKKKEEDSKSNITITEEEIANRESKLEELPDFEEVLQDAEIENKEEMQELGQIIDEAIDIVSSEDTEQIETIKEVFETEVNKDEFMELLKSKHLENIEATTQVIQTANDVIKEKANLASMVMTLTKDVVKLISKNHKLEEKQNKLALKWMGLGAVVGGVLVYLFPEYLPYVKDAWNYLRGGD